MRNKIRSTVWSVSLFVLVVLSSCTAKKISVQKTPKTQVVASYQDNLLLSGNPKRSKPWIVYTTTANTPLYADEKSESADKSVAFFTPFVVLKHKGNRYKVAQYEAGSLVEGKLNSAQIKEQGWIQQNDLLLWTASLREEITGFCAKGILALQEKSVLPLLEMYMEKDSLFVFNDPGLQHKVQHKLALNTLVYLYAFSADQKKIFLGTTPKVQEGDTQGQVYGWVDARVVGLWGQRTAFRMKPIAGGEIRLLDAEMTTTSKTVFTPVLQSDTLDDQSRLMQLYPLVYRATTQDFKSKYFDQVLDYRENKVYNIDGQSIGYDSYRQILTDNRKLNVVFLLDGSPTVVQHFDSLKGILQGLDEQLATTNYFHSISCATLFYHVDQQDKRRIETPLLNLAHWQETLDQPFKLARLSSKVSTLNEAMKDVHTLLASRANQMNLVVVIGQRLTAADQIKQEEWVEDITQTGSRVLFYQVKANSGDEHNDFVLTGEAVIRTSAEQIGRAKRQRLVEQQEIVTPPMFDLSLGDQGVYQLDYPAKSMHQGAVIFPAKGEETNPIRLQQVLVKMVQDIIQENQHVDQALTVAFSGDKGVSKTKVKVEYEGKYQHGKTLVAIPIAKQLINQNYAFMHEEILQKLKTNTENTVEYGVLLDEEEMQQLQEEYRRIYQRVIKKGDLNNQKMIRKYITAVRKNNRLASNKKRKFWRKNTMYLGLFQQTGLYRNPSDSNAKLTLAQWKHKDLLNTAMLKDFFRQFKSIADQIEEEKANQLRLVQQNGANFYWLNQTYLPVLDERKAKDVEQNFDFLFLELEKIKGIKYKKNRREYRTNEYIKRVKEGIF